MKLTHCLVEDCEQEIVTIKELVILDAYDIDGKKLGRLPVTTGWCEEHAFFSMVYAQYHALVNRATARDQEVKSLPQMTDIEMVRLEASPVSVDEANEIQDDEDELRKAIGEALAERPDAVSISMDGEKFLASKTVSAESLYQLSGYKPEDVRLYRYRPDEDEFIDVRWDDVDVFPGDTFYTKPIE